MLVELTLTEIETLQRAVTQWRRIVKEVDEGSPEVSNLKVLAVHLSQTKQSNLKRKLRGGM